MVNGKETPPAVVYSLPMVIRDVAARKITNYPSPLLENCFANCPGRQQREEGENVDVTFSANVGLKVTFAFKVRTLFSV